jgi:hypothetical protein
MLPSFKHFSDRVETKKPAASRETSAEIFICCFGFKSPTNIEQRLLDHRFIFNELNEIPRAIGINTLATQHKKKRDLKSHENTSTCHKISLATSFIESCSPLEFLKNCSQLVIDEQVYEITKKANKIRELCKDLRVINSSDLKMLLNWRKSIRKNQDKQNPITLASYYEDDIERKILYELKEIHLGQNTMLKRRVKNEKTNQKSSKKDGVGRSKVENTISFFKGPHVIEDFPFWGFIWKGVHGEGFAVASVWFLTLVRVGSRMLPCLFFLALAFLFFFHGPMGALKKRNSIFDF